ncbi:hypothetical protein CR513_36658, partial [Mucuna pruriens]
ADVPSVNLFVRGKDLWGDRDPTNKAKDPLHDIGGPMTSHVDGNTVALNKDQDNVAHAKWKSKDAQVMTWILGFVDPTIVLNLRPYQITTTFWAYLKRIYSQNNPARRFQLEHNIAAFIEDSLSILDFYS